MAIGCYAKIAREDYAAFRALVSDLPQEYERWLYVEQARKVNDLFEFGDWEGQDIEIGPAEFLAWCEARGQPCTRHNLDLLATEKWLRQSRRF